MKNKKEKHANRLLNHTASANECTGALQRIVPDPKELEKFRKQFNADK